MYHRCFLQPYRRNMDERFDRVMYLRDRRLTYNPYILNVSKLIRKTVITFNISIS